MNHSFNNLCIIFDVILVNVRLATLRDFYLLIDDCKFYDNYNQSETLFHGKQFILVHKIILTQRIGDKIFTIQQI